jgi:hypothetical protein
MATADHIRNNIIDKLLTINNKDYLTALFKLIEKSSVDMENAHLTEEQITMLKLSEIDIKNNQTISQKQLDKEDLKWLTES